jgi:hypothetical protein
MRGPAACHARSPRRLARPWPYGPVQLRTSSRLEHPRHAANASGKESGGGGLTEEVGRRCGGGEWPAFR